MVRIVGGHFSWEGWRVSVTLRNPTDDDLEILLPSDCLVVGVRHDDRTTPWAGPEYREDRHEGCQERLVLQRHASARIRAEPELAFGSPLYSTASEITWTVTARVTEMRINGGEPEDSEQIHVGTLTLEFPGAADGSTSGG